MPLYAMLSLSTTLSYFPLHFVAMHPDELASFNSMSFEIPTQFQSNFIPTAHLNGFLNNLPTSFPSGHEFALQPSSGVSNNSTSDEAEEQQFGVIDERKRRRMISNRESARRSRMRKQRQIDELLSLVVRLRTENRDLVDKLKMSSECHEKVLVENSQLKQESAGLCEMITSVQFGSPLSALTDLDDIPCSTTTTPLRGEGSNAFPSHICVSKLEI